MLGDENVANSRHGSLDEDFIAWVKQARDDVEANLKQGLVCYESDGEQEQEEDDEDEEDNGGVVDLEDLGNAMSRGTVRLMSHLSLFLFLFVVCLLRFFFIQIGGTLRSFLLMRLNVL